MSDMERIFSALERIEEAHNQLAVQVHAVSVCLDRSVPRRPALSPVYFLTSHSLAHRTTTESPRSSARSTISPWVDRRSLLDRLWRFAHVDTPFPGQDRQDWDHIPPPSGTAGTPVRS